MGAWGGEGKESLALGVKAEGKEAPSALQSTDFGGLWTVCEMQAQFCLVFVTPNHTNKYKHETVWLSILLMLFKKILEQAVVNEDTQGNVTQLQAEVKRLKEQLAQLTAGQIPPESFRTGGTTGAVSSNRRKSRHGY